MNWHSYKVSFLDTITIPFLDKNGNFVRKEIQSIDEVTKLVIWHLEQVENQDWWWKGECWRVGELAASWYEAIESSLDREMVINSACRSFIKSVKNLENKKPRYPKATRDLIKTRDKRLK